MRMAQPKITEIQLATALGARGTPRFAEALKHDIEQLDARLLPLQQGLSVGNHVVDTPLQAMIISVAEDETVIRATVGLFYAGILTGCSCADDPTPVEAQNEYCEVEIEIDKITLIATVIPYESTSHAV